jgi:hypothetical protein
MSPPAVADIVVRLEAEPVHSTIPRPFVEVPFERPVMLIAVPETLADESVVLYPPVQLSSTP